MKLRFKLTAVMLSLLCAALILFSLLTISACRDLMLEDSVSYTVTGAENLLNQAWQLTGVHGTDTVKRAIIEYRFRQLALKNGKTKEYVLQENDDIIYNNSGIDAQKALCQADRDITVPEKDDAGNIHDNRIYSCQVSVNQRDYCIAGSIYEIDGKNYTISLVHDVSRYMDKVRQITRYCMAISAAVLLLTALTVICLLQHILAPIQTLQKQAADLSVGNYDVRIPIVSHDELAALSQSFNEMADAVKQHIQEVESQSEQRRMLLSALGHEMKTPVTSITGYCWMLLHTRLTPEQQEDALFYVDAECRRLERLSGKLNQLISLEHPDPENLRQTFPAGELGETIRHTLTPPARQCNILLHIRTETDVSYTGDPDLLTMLITNLFDNARKASARIIVIELKKDIISVRDNGNGIPEEQLDRVTQPFYQGDSSRNTEGFGLGLALCEKIAHLHGGTLRIESEYGTGTTVTLYFTTP